MVLSAVLEDGVVGAGGGGDGEGRTAGPIKVDDEHVGLRGESP